MSGQITPDTDPFQVTGKSSVLSMSPMATHNKQITPLNVVFPALQKAENRQLPQQIQQNTNS